VTHPELSDMLGKQASRTRGVVDPFVNTAACRELVEWSRDGLGRRVASEIGKQP